MNPLLELRKLGQSVWLDYIRRDILTTDKLRNMIREDDVRGLTSNPTIFGKAISQSDLYDAFIKEFVKIHPKADVADLYDHLVIRDIQIIKLMGGI